MFLTVLTKDGNFFIYEITLERKFDPSKDPHGYIKNQSRNFEEPVDEEDEEDTGLKNEKPKTKREKMKER
jgi:hypothetical protein